ncbi:PilZ domain-containing protein [Marinobacter lacisalsi]|uniref:PilZ domain-containing protein n=1 Tax=Marinobacter lacisalsi TaxID=475979 RepID=A0ABV8QL83_9GAMM
MSPDQYRPDRRDFFRIEDRIGLEYRRLGHGETGAGNPFAEDHLDSLKAELKRLDQEFRNQLPVLAERDRLTAALLKSLNGKVDTLARIMAFEQNPLQPEQWRDVTLSEGGVSFQVVAGELSPGDILALRLTLPPELYRPQAKAEVIEVTPLESPQDASLTLVHTSFIDIQDADRQQIAKHVMGWQIRQRQSGEPSQ